MAAFPTDLDAAEFTFDKVTRHVYRGRGDGPAVILIHEAAGLNARTVLVAHRLSEAGLQPVLPVLLGHPSEKTSLGQLLGNVRRICVAAEFKAWAEDERTPIVDWLRALARDEHERTGGRGVGVIGMCFSGGFALAMVTEPVVAAAVAGEPAIPWPIPTRRTELAMSADELGEVARRANEGFCVRALRYQRDFKSPGVRMRFLAEMLPNASVVEIPTRNFNRHSVLADAVTAPPTSDLGRALDGTIRYLTERLLPPGATA